MAGTLRAVVVDDEAPAREELEALLQESGEATVIAACGNAVQAIRTIKGTRPDVVFLDIQMPKVDGLRMLSMIDPEIMPLVVFVTAYDEYAIQAFEKSAIDYLLKPVQPERLAQALARVKRFLGEGRRPQYDSPAIERIPCMGAQSIKLIDISDVEFVRSSETGVHVVTARSEFLTELTLTVLEAKARQLVRCHKQFLVNLRQIDEIVRHDPTSASLKTRSGKHVPVSRRFLGPLKEQLGI
jgi:two-component system LytT family response regulator